MKQRLNRLPQKELPGFSPAERDVIHGAAIAQDTLPVEHKYMGGCNRIKLIGDNVPGVNQDFWDAPCLGHVFHQLNGFVLIRSNGQQLHLPIPHLEQIKNYLIRPRGMRALCRPKIDDDNFPPIITQAMKSSIYIGQYKIRSRLIKFHSRDYIK
jgi:hypothetical protein